jgi:hypothetical protein
MAASNPRVGVVLIYRKKAQETPVRSAERTPSGDVRGPHRLLLNAVFVLLLKTAEFRRSHHCPRPEQNPTGHQLGHHLKRTQSSRRSPG